MVKIVNKQVVGLPKLPWANGKPTVIVMHETANNSNNGSYTGEINFMTNNWRNAFYHAIAGESDVAQLHNPDIGGAWGAGPSMHKYAIHIELVRSSTKEGFLKAYKNWIGAAVYYAKKYNIPINLNKGKNKRGIMTHKYVTQTFGGTTHQDPDAYLSRWGVSIAQLEKDIKSVAKDNNVTVKPNNKPKRPVTVHSGSIVDYLKAQRLDSSFEGRKKLAKEHGIKNYKGTEKQNIDLLNKLQKKPSSSKNTTVKGITAYIQDTVNKRYSLGIAVDNLRGPETYRALLKAYQTELNKQFNAGLNVDGLWGPKTDRAGVTVRPGARGNLTWVLQAILYVKGYTVVGKPDKIFGDNTEKAVRACQKATNQAVDGIPGRNTFRALFA